MAIIDKPEGRIRLSATPAEALQEQQPVMEIEIDEFDASMSSPEVKATMERVERWCRDVGADEVGDTGH